MDRLITQEIEELVATGEKLVTDASVAERALDYARVQELISITARGGQLITRLYGSASHYFQMFNTITQPRDFDIMYR